MSILAALGPQERHIEDKEQELQKRCWNCWGHHYGQLGTVVYGLVELGLFLGGVGLIINYLTEVTEVTV